MSPCITAPDASKACRHFYIFLFQFQQQNVRFSLFHINELADSINRFEVPKTEINRKEKDWKQESKSIHNEIYIN